MNDDNDGGGGDKVHYKITCRNRQTKITVEIIDKIVVGITD